MLQSPEIDWKARIETYVDDVVSGKTVAGESVRHTCQRFLKDLERTDIYFDWHEAIRACRFFSLLKFSDGSYVNKPFLLYPPQAFIVGSIQGWRNPSGFRRYRRAFIDVARGNGKTPLSAGLALLLTGFDGEATAEGYVVATKRDQARDFCWSDARRFSERAGFVKHNYVKLYQGSIVFPGSGSSIKALGSDSKTQDSMRIHLLCCEELHAWTKHDHELWMKLETALGKRDQPMMIVTTTHGNEHSDIWRREYSYAKAVVDPRQATNDDTVFAYIAEMDPGDDIYAEKNFEKSNPLLPYGVVKADYLRGMAEKAKVSSEARVAWKRFHCNIYSTSHDKPVTPEMWAKGSGLLPDLEGRECRLGLDLGWRRDLAALVAAFPLDNLEMGGEIKRQYAVKCWAWCPTVDTERQLTMPPWCDWVDNGWLIPTQTRTTDTDQIFGLVEELSKKYWVKSLALDPYNAREFAARCIERMKLDVYEFNQNCRKFHEPTQETLLAMNEGRLKHGDNPLLGWACHNVVLRRDTAGYCMPDKSTAEEKIDPFVAMVMAISECMFNAPLKQSYYESNPIEIW